MKLWEFLAIAGWPFPWLIGIFLLGTVLFFVVTSLKRAKIDAALPNERPELGMFDLSRGDASKALAEKRIIAPERLWTYGAEYLEKFSGEMRRTRLAGGGTALGYYNETILRRWDTAFAVCLGLFTALFNFSASAGLLAHHPCGAGAVLVLAGLGVLYGVADVMENFKLATILQRGEGAGIDAGEAAAANALTRIKLVAITLSITGLATFLILFGIMKVVRRLTAGGRTAP
jgi:hypothetical protein